MSQSRSNGSIPRDSEVRKKDEYLVPRLAIFLATLPESSSRYLEDTPQTYLVALYQTCHFSL